jgi:hypothetical protein
MMARRFHVRNIAAALAPPDGLIHSALYRLESVGRVVNIEAARRRAALSIKGAPAPCCSDFRNCFMPLELRIG